MALPTEREKRERERERKEKQAENGRVHTDNLGNMKSLENCQIVCNNAALATWLRPGDDSFSVRGWRAAYRAADVCRRDGRRNFVRGPLQILRQQESAVGCLFWLVTLTLAVSLRLPRAAALPAADEANPGLTLSRLSPANREPPRRRKGRHQVVVPSPHDSIPNLFLFVFESDVLSRRNCRNCPCSGCPHSLLPLFPPAC